MLHSTSRSGPPQFTSSTPQSEASSSNQSQKDQEMQFQDRSDGLVPLPFNANGAVGSGTSTRDLENSLQKAQENFIKSQIEVRQNLYPKSTQLTSFHATL
jgi:E3 ubiquitin-protein ligase synoviolin